MGVKPATDSPAPRRMSGGSSLRVLSFAVRRIPLISSLLGLALPTSFVLEMVTGTASGRVRAAATRCAMAQAPGPLTVRATVIVRLVARGRARVMHAVADGGTDSLPTAPPGVAPPFRTGCGSGQRRQSPRLCGSLRLGRR